MNNIIDSDLIDNIWKDAKFDDFTKKVETKVDIKKNKIRKVTEYNLVIANCKVCNCELKISCEYNGDYPLCYRHRNPNDRPIKIPK